MPPPRKARTEGAANFVPDDFLKTWKPSAERLEVDDLKGAIISAFKLKSNDDYVYHAIASVTLNQVQHAIQAGGQHGLHAWYLFEDGKQKPPPLRDDIEAYISIFSPTTATAKALKAFACNAKKDTTRAAVAEHLQRNFQAPATESKLVLPKPKSDTENPYYNFWAWSCKNLEWVGPTAGTAMTRQSHHILPVFYHHFGCVCPTQDALSLIQQLSKQGQSKGASRSVIDMGSGNGYWTYLLRRLGLTVYAVDNELSAWRTMWIGDTIIADGTSFLSKTSATHSDLGEGAQNAVLVLVYPQVSEDFTSQIIRAYKGDTIVVAGTQNTNGFTAFKEQTIAQWMQQERPMFEQIGQIPLPSFAGKDEALFLFQSRRPKDTEVKDPS